MFRRQESTSIEDTSTVAYTDDTTDADTTQMFETRSQRRRTENQRALLGSVEIALAIVRNLTRLSEVDERIEDDNIIEEPSKCVDASSLSIAVPETTSPLKTFESSKRCSELQLLRDNGTAKTENEVNLRNSKPPKKFNWKLTASRKDEYVQTVNVVSRQILSKETTI